MRHPKHPGRFIKHSLSLLFLAAAIAVPAHPQGCSQCSEAVGQTPARTQSAYRKAIILMVVAGASVFGAAVILLKRYR
jgi:hypothetical protein